MTGKVVPFAGGALVQGEPCEEVVLILRQLLAQAERGELVALAYAGVRPEHSGRIITGFDGAPHTSFHLSSAVSCLFHRYHEHLNSPDNRYEEH